LTCSKDKPIKVLQEDAMGIAPQVDTAYLSALVGEPRVPLLMAKADIAPLDQALPERLDMADFWRCCAENIRLTNDESHGTALQPVPPGSLSLLVMAAKEADTLDGALHRLTEAARLVRTEVRLALSHGRGTMRLTIVPAGPTPGPQASLRMAIYCECFAIVIHCALRWMTGRRLDPVRVRGAAELRLMGGELLLALGAPLARRGVGVSIDYAVEDQAASILPRKYTAWGEAEFATFLDMLAQGEPVPLASDHARVIEALRAGLHTQEEVAAALSISVPTLRRRLAQDSLSFRDMSAQFRTRQLQDLLSTQMPLAAIAEQLGLSDERSLRRFARAHLGQAPAKYRGRLG
jgi:AraC-like DNA-binding protein